LLSIEGAPFCSGFEPDTQNPTPKGAPFYIASDYRTCSDHLRPVGCGWPLPNLLISSLYFDL
jgi:hypothetical protein